MTCSELAGASSSGHVRYDDELHGICIDREKEKQRNLVPTERCTEIRTRYGVVQPEKRCSSGKCAKGFQNLGLKTLIETKTEAEERLRWIGRATRTHLQRQAGKAPWV